MILDGRISRISSISFKLMLAFVTFITLPMLINGLLMFSKTRNILENRISAYTQSTLSFIGSDVDNLIQGYDLDFVDLYGRKAVFDELKTENGTDYTDKLKSEVLINDDLGKYLTNYDSFESVYFMPNGENVYFASKSGVKNEKLISMFNSSPDLKNKILELNGKGIWFPLNDGNTSYLCRARVFKDIYGNFNNMGIALICINLNGISGICSDIHVPQNASLYILDPGNEVVFKKREEKDIDVFLASDDSMGLFKQKNGIILANIGSTKYAAIYNTSKNSGWKFLEFIKESELTSDIFEIRSYYLFITILSILFFIIITYIISQYISNPIKKLAQAMKGIKKGNLGVIVSTRTRGEVGILYDSFNEMKNRIKNLISDIRKASIKEKESEIQALKAQLNPHFLYNSLAAVNWMAVKNNQYEISDMLTNLSDLLRYCLDKGSGDVVTLKEDYRWYKSYVDFQKMRFDEGFEIIFNIDPFVLDCKVHKLMLQPLIENSILHGLEGVKKGGLIIVNIHGNENYIHFTVTDNGKGMDEKIIEQIRNGNIKGMGIKNVYDRIKLYYGDQYELEIKSEPGQGTSIAFRIPRDENC